MKIKITITIVMTLLVGFCFSQTPLEVQKIVGSYDLSELDKLRDEFQSIHDLKDKRIQDFLKNNPEISFQLVKNNVLYQMVDVIAGKPIYVSTDNASAAIATKTVALHNGGELGLNLEGQNMNVGVWDGGFVLKNHVEFMNDEATPTSRITTPQTVLPNPATNDHATHVMGTIVAKGVNATAKGMAPKANAVSYNWTNDLANVTTQIATNGLLISNHSYGVPVISESGNAQDAWVMGCYDSESRQWDQLAFASPYYLMVTSAGNSGSETYTGGMAAGYDKLTFEKNAKNNLVVANSNPFVLPNGSVNLFPINSSSSQGPSDDGRIKPDIAGDGTNLLSTFNTNTTSYATLTGTSMASPNVAGSLLLLQQYYNQLNSVFMRSSTLKGLACHTARDGGTAGPDAKFGWGLLDAKKAAEVITKNNENPKRAIIFENQLAQSEVYTIQVGVTSGEKLEATLSWIDPAGLPKDGNVNDATPALVNDLDLRISKDSNVFFPWKLQVPNVAAAAITGDNIVDNIEKVEVTNPDGIYTITVSHKGNLQSGPQAYSLIVTGANFQSLSLNEVSENAISIYPNPTSGIVNFNTNDSSIIKSIVVFDFCGKMIRKIQNAESLNSFDISDLSSGLYVVDFYTQDDLKIVKKIIKN